MYEFASSVINVWEKKILSKNDQERMLTAPDKEEAFMVLYDTDLAEFASKNQDIEKIFEQDLCSLKDRFIYALQDGEIAISYLFFVYDVWNLKMAFKKTFLEPTKENQGEPFTCGLTDYNTLKAIIDQKTDFSAVKLDGNVYLEKLINLSFAFLRDIPDITSAAIETAVDRAYFAVKKEMASQISSFLEKFIKTEIDAVNVKSLFSKAKPALFIAGGNLSPDDLQNLSISKEGEIIEENLSEFLEVLELSFLVEKFKKNQSEPFLEQGLQDFLSNEIFEKARAVGFGIPKVIAFFYKKINSHFNIRLILFAKENNLAIDEIEKLLLPI